MSVDGFRRRGDTARVEAATAFVTLLTQEFAPATVTAMLEAAEWGVAYRSGAWVKRMKREGYSPDDGYPELRP